MACTRRVLGFQSRADHINLSCAKALKQTNARASKRPAGNSGSSLLRQWYAKQGAVTNSDDDWADRPWATEQPGMAAAPDTRWVESSDLLLVNSSCYS